MVVGPRPTCTLGVRITVSLLQSLHTARDQRTRLGRISNQNCGFSGPDCSPSVFKFQTRKVGRVWGWATLHLTWQDWSSWKPDAGSSLWSQAVFFLNKFHFYQRFNVPVLFLLYSCFSWLLIGSYQLWANSKEEQNLGWWFVLVSDFGDKSHKALVGLELMM